MSAADAVYAVQFTRDDDMVRSVEGWARKVVENPDDPCREQARRLLELRPEIHRRVRLGLTYNDLMAEFWLLGQAARLNRHAAVSAPKRPRARQPWAVDAAERLAETAGKLEKPGAIVNRIGDSHKPLTLSEDLELYRSGTRIVGLDPVTERDTGSLSRDAFIRWYLRPALKKVRGG